jgi:hypothetical protein
MFSFFKRRRERERLASRRDNHDRWAEIPYGKPVQIMYRRVATDRLVGTAGRVLTEKEHGITRHGGWVELTPNFPGIRGVHVYVRFGDSPPELLSLSDLAPA